MATASRITCVMKRIMLSLNAILMKGTSFVSGNSMAVGGDADELGAVGLLQGLEEKALCKRPVDLC